MFIKKIFPVIAIFVVLFPFIVSTAAAAGATGIWPTGYWGPLISCTGDYAGVGSSAASSAGLGTCKDLCDLLQTVVNVIYFAMSIGIFIIAPILLAVGAIMIMVSGANPEMLSKGKKTLTGTIIGMVIILGSYLIVSTAVTFLGLSQYVVGFGSGTCAPAGQ